MSYLDDTVIRKNISYEEFLNDLVTLIQYAYALPVYAKHNDSRTSLLIVSIPYLIASRPSA